MQTAPKTQIIYLNGPSSSGKTTLAKALQELLEEPFLHIGIDQVISWMPEKINDWKGGPAPLGFSWKNSRDAEGHLVHELQIGPYAEKMETAFREVVVSLAKLRLSVIIDDVCLKKKHFQAWKDCLSSFSVLWVGLKTPLAHLEEREKKRGDRILGSARNQFYRVHQGLSYDLEIDSSCLTVQEEALWIQKHLAR